MNCLSVSVATFALMPQTIRKSVWHRRGIGKQRRRRVPSGCALGGVLLLKLLAPALDFRVIENLPDNAAQQALQAGILQVAQRPNGFLLVSLIQLTSAFVGL